MEAGSSGALISPERYSPTLILSYKRKLLFDRTDEIRHYLDFGRIYLGGEEFLELELICFPHDENALRGDVLQETLPNEDQVAEGNECSTTQGLQVPNSRGI